MLWLLQEVTACIEFLILQSCVLVQAIPGGKVSILGCHVIGHSKQKRLCMSFSELMYCTVPKLISKRYNAMLLILVFIVQVTKLVQFAWYDTVLKIPPTSMHFVIRVRTWRVAGLYSTAK
jgi:hypothetical protein